MICTLFAACVLCLTVDSAVGETFRGYNHVHNTLRMFRSTYNKYHGKDGIKALTKTASKGEMAERLKNFRKMVEVVNDINDDKSLTYTAGLNFISVMTKDEIDSMVNLDRVNISDYESGAEIQKPFTILKQPKGVNWVERGALPPVKNQGRCGSCWAFAAGAAIEGNYFTTTGDQESFSEQEYVDCATERASSTHDGCRGGWMPWIFDYIKELDRIALEKDFEYVAKDRPCDMKGVPNGLKKARMTGWTYVSGSDEILLEASAQYVITICTTVKVPPFMSYREGIFTCTPDKGCNCQVTCEHAMALVGYGESYWIVRNSWGQGWGENGYIRMSRKQDNICYINKWAMIPVLECREGQKCKKWDGGDEDDEKEDEEDFDVGKPIKCGEIEHYGGRCVDLADSGSDAVLTNIGCDRQFCLTDKGYIQDKATSKCLTTSNHWVDNNLITFGACNKAYKWSETAKGAIQIQAKSGKCWHPLGGRWKPPNGNKICIYSGCDGGRLQFKMKENLCWEEISGNKLYFQLQDSKGKPLEVKGLDDAKDLCLETDGCKGLYFTENKYYLAGSDKLWKSENKGDKAFVIVDCSKACDAGTQRCEDGECREKCDKDDDDCPAGTTRCSDGLCKHENLC